jgi:hypothetical protein
MTLSECLKISDAQFRQYLQFNLSLISNQIKDNQTDIFLNSNPNFNYLYSNYTESYKEPATTWTQFGVDPNIINLAYGPDLDVIDL